MPSPPPQADPNGNGVVDYEEFEGCVRLLEDTVVRRVLEEFGVTPARLVFGFLYSVTCLLLLFGFIFVGIAAFRGANTFASVVNSIMPIASGAGLGLKSAAGQSAEAVAELEATVKRVLRNMA